MTVLGAVQGNVDCKSLQLEKGKIEGNVSATESMTAQEGTEVKGDITANSADLSGHSEGAVAIAKDLQLNDTAVIVGDVKAGSVCISSGSMIRGKFDIGFDANAAKEEKSAPKTKETAQKKDDEKK